MIAVLVTLALVVVVVVADVVSRDRAEAAIAMELTAELGVPVDTSIGELGTGLAVLFGRVNRLEVAAADVPLPDVQPSGRQVTDLQAVITDVELDGGRPVAGRGTFAAAFDQTQVRRAVPAEIAPNLTLAGGQLVLDVVVAQIPIEIAVDGPALQFRPAGDLGVLGDLVGEATRVPLDVPDGVVVEQADVKDDRVVLRGTLDPVVLAER